MRKRQPLSPGRFYWSMGDLALRERDFILFSQNDAGVIFFALHPDHDLPAAGNALITGLFRIHKKPLRRIS